MKTRLTILLIYSLILFGGLTLLLFLDLHFNLHATLPLVPIRPLGVLTSALLISVIIIALKKLKRLQSAVSIIKYSLFGTLIVLISEMFLQFIRQCTFEGLEFNERLTMYIQSLIGATIFGFIISFLTAFQLKTKKTNQLVLIIVGLLICYNILVRIFPTVFRQ